MSTELIASSTEVGSAEPVPDRGLRPASGSTWGVRLVTLGLALSCFSGHWSDMRIGVPLDRVLLITGALLSLARFRSRGGRAFTRPIHLVMVLATAWTSLSAVAVGTFQGAGFFALVDRFVGLFAIVAIAPIVYYDVEARRFFCRVFAVLGLYLAVTAVGESLTALRFLVWPSYILDPSVGIHFGRARGPYVEAVANGMILCFCGALALVAAFTDRLRAWRVGGAIICVLCAVGVLLTVTRSVWLGAAAAALITGVCVPSFRRWVIPIGGSVAAVLAVVYVSVPGLADNAGARAADQLPVWDRLNSNAAAVRMVLDNPLFGIGWHNSDARMGQFVRQGDSYPVLASSGVLEVHNVFLSRLAEIGIPGFVLWLVALLGTVGFAILRTPAAKDINPIRAALLSMLVAWMFGAMLSPMSTFQPNYLLWCVAGVVLSDYLVSPPTDRRPDDLRSEVDA